MEVCLVTTRETRRWSIPKGWPMKGLKDHLAAALEAEEEAGVFGKIAKRPCGSYLYWKRLEDRFELVRVVVFRLEVAGGLSQWRERDQRDVQWVPIGEAGHLVEESGLAALFLEATAAEGNLAVGS